VAIATGMNTTAAAIRLKNFVMSVLPQSVLVNRVWR
jgi:hypothetical protein